LANVSLMACPECDLVHQMSHLPATGTALCARCGAVLRQGSRRSLDTPLALAFTSLVLFGIANAYPLLVLQLHGSWQEATIPGCAKALVTLGWPWLAAILITTVIVAPPIYMCGLSFVLIQAKRHRNGPWTARIFRIVLEFQTWAMSEVFLLGILVAYVKLTDMALVAPGFSIYALAGFIITVSAVASSLDPMTVWDALGDRA
jgi:paraquat-inducible protein A